MASAKDMVIKPVTAKTANDLVRRFHYSGKVVNNSQLHFGVFLNGRIEGAMQFGPSLDKRKLQGLVEGTTWNGFIELNRMAFSDALPRNSESRAIAVAFRLIRKHYPHIEWVVSFSDGTQSGDGAIYRASGFVLTGIKKNTQIWTSPPDAGRAVASRTTLTKGKHVLGNGAASMKQWQDAGWSPLAGFQLRYVHFLNPDARSRITVPILPFSKIEEMGAGMYRGEKISRAKQAMAEHPSAQRQGSTDPHAPDTQAA